MQGCDTYAGYLINDIVEFLPEKRTLVRKDNMQSVALHAPASGCLVSLIEHHSNLVSQEDLIIAGWGDLHGHVSPNTFYQAILGLRQCLEEVGLSKDFIITVRRRGLLLSPSAFIKQIDAPGTVPPLNLTSEEEVIINPDVKNSNTNKKIILHNYKFIVAALLLIIIFILIYINTKRNPQLFTEVKYEYFSGYYQLQKYQNCHIFANNPLLNYNAYISFIKENKLACDQREWWYISSDINSPRISVVRCINDVVNASKNYCSTDYYYRRK